MEIRHYLMGKTIIESLEKLIQIEETKSFSRNKMSDI